MEIVRHADGKLSVHAESIGAEDVDALIRDLANQRAQMSPEVPTSVETAFATGRLLVTVEPHLAFSRSASGLITLLVRHRGHGWFAFELPDEQAALIRNVLNKRLPADVKQVLDDVRAEVGTKGH